MKNQFNVGERVWLKNEDEDEVFGIRGPYIVCRIAADEAPDGEDPILTYVLRTTEGAVCEEADELRLVRDTAWSVRAEAELMWDASQPHEEKPTEDEA